MLTSVTLEAAEASFIQIISVTSKVNENETFLKIFKHCDVDQLPNY